MALQTFGNEYTKVKNMYFSDRKDITAHEINNLCCRHQKLKPYQQSNNKKSRVEIVEDFKKQRQKQDFQALSTTRNQPVITNVDDDEDQLEIVSEPTRLSSGMWLVPSVEYFRVGPFFSETPDGYHYCYRYHYGEPVSFRINRVERKIIFKFKSVPSLSSQEYNSLQLFKPSSGKDAETIILSECQIDLSNYIVYVPSDADLYTFCLRNSSEDKKNHLYFHHETESGGLLELLIPKMQEINDDFSAPRSNVSISISSKNVPLQGTNKTNNGEQ
jgi:hypothetical protein